MTTWFTSDWHLFHSRIIKYDNAPFRDLSEMHSSFIQEWNSKVSSDDFVWVLGDFSFGGRKKTSQLTDQLTGRKILVRGNHDKQTKTACLEGMKFEDVLQKTTISVGEYKVGLSHFPYRDFYPEDFIYNKLNHRFFYSDDQDIDVLLHGHVHTSWQTKIFNDKLMINVGFPAHNYKLLSEKNIVDIIKNNLDN